MATILGYLPTEQPTVPSFNGPIEFEEDQNLWDVIKNGTVKGFLNVAQGFTGTAESMVELFGYGPENEFLSNVTNNIRQASEKFEVNPDNKLEWVASIVSQAVPYMGAALAGGMAGGAIGAGLVGFSVEGQQAYDDAVERGVSPEKANFERLVVGSINAVIEGAQVGQMLKLKGTARESLKKVVGNARNRAWKKMGGEFANFSKDVLKNSVNESIEEFLQETVSTFVPAGFEGKEALPLDSEGNVDYTAIGNRLGAAALAGAVVSPFLSVSSFGLPGKGYEIAPPNLGKVTEAQAREMFETVKNSDLPSGVKENELNRVKEWLKKSGIDIGTEEEIPEYEVSKRFREKVESLEDSIRPKHKQRIKEQRGQQASEFRNRMESVPEHFSETQRAHFALAGMKVDPINDFVPLLQDTFVEEDMDFLRGEARKKADLYNDFELARVNIVIDKIFEEGKLPEPAEIDLLERLVGEKAAKSLKKASKKQMTMGTKARRAFMALANLPRAVQASVDFSGAGRQGLFIAFLRPKVWAKSVLRGYQAFGNPQVAQLQKLRLMTNPLFPLAQKSGVDVTETGGGIKAEEPFISTLAHEIPLVKRSELAYTTTLNTMRLESFYSIAEGWLGQGKTDEDFKQLASVLNHLSGRGDLKLLKNHANILNVMFFSPRLFASRFNVFTDLAKVDSPTWNILAGTLLEAFGTGVLVLGLLRAIAEKKKGMEVEIDPRSGDFGKVKIGNTRIDYWMGYSQIMRTVARVIPSKVYNVFGYGGNIKSGNTKEVYDQRTLDVVVQFLQTKLSPAAGLAVDLYTGEDFKGDAITSDRTAGQIWERVAPFFLQDMVDAARYQGWDGLIPTSVLGLHGIGAMTYPLSKSNEAINTKNAVAMKFFGKKWGELGPTFQKALRESNPLIEIADRRARQERLGKAASNRAQKEARSSERFLRKSFKPQVRDELDRLLVSVGGLGRQVGSGWFLNDKKYLQYKLTTLNMLNRILPMFTQLNMPDRVKQALIEDTINSIKQKARQKIMLDADISDLVNK